MDVRVVWNVQPLHPLLRKQREIAPKDLPSGSEVTLIKNYAGLLAANVKRLRSYPIPPTTGFSTEEAQTGIFAKIELRVWEGKEGPFVLRKF